MRTSRGAKAARIVTSVPSNGRARTSSRVAEEDIVGSQQAFDAVGDVTARQRRTGNVLDVAIELQRVAVLLADELRAPPRVPHFATVGFAILEDLDAADA